MAVFNGKGESRTGVVDSERTPRAKETDQHWAERFHDPEKSLFAVYQQGKTSV
jgi:hypothetical protein